MIPGLKKASAIIQILKKITVQQINTPILNQRKIILF